MVVAVVVVVVVVVVIVENQAVRMADEVLCPRYREAALLACSILGEWACRALGLQA